MAYHGREEEMITIGTAIFHRIIEEARQQAQETLRKAAVKALADTMKHETPRFCAFDETYVHGCASDRLENYVRNAGATCGKEVVDVTSGNTAA